MELTQKEIEAGLRRLGIGKEHRLIVHSSLKSFGRVEGGPLTIIKALREVCGTILMPTFTWDAIYYPDGWEKNLNSPASRAPEDVEAANRKAVPYTPDAPTSRSIGIIPETLRLEPDAKISRHPIHRYAAVGPDADLLVNSQTPDRPLEPIVELRKLGGGILLLGVGHDRNTAIHLAEREIGRRQWTCWALTRDDGVVECTNHPGCSAKFEDVEPLLRDITRETIIGQCRARLLPLKETVELVRNYLGNNPKALLCGECKRCQIILNELESNG